MATIPTFPEFTVLSSSHKAAYNEFISKFPPHADLSFGNLMVWWSLAKEVEVSMLNGNIVIRYTNPFSSEDHLFYTLAGTTQVANSLDRLFDYQISLQEPPQSILTPDFLVESIEDPSKYTIIPDEDNWDYILSTEMHATLADSSLSRTRRKVRRFQREAGNVEVKPIDLTSIKNKLMLTQTTRGWENAFPVHNNETNQEVFALDKVLLLAELVDLRCLAVFVDDKLEGYSLYRYLPQSEYCVVSHIKESKHYPHIFDFITHAVATTVHEEGIKFMNFEQDLGLPGLRFHKQGLRPVTMLKKYTVSP